MRLETRYIDIEKSISIIDRNFHIDFISTISIIYGNTSQNISAWHPVSCPRSVDHYDLEAATAYTINNVSWAPTASQWFINSLYPGEATWWQINRSTLGQVMAWCRQAASHFLNQCWLIINEVLWHSPVGCFMEILKTSVFDMKITTTMYKI